MRYGLLTAMKTRFWLLWAGIGLLIHSAVASDELLDKLQPQGMVTDVAGVFEPGSKAGLEQFLGSVKAAAVAEIAVVTLPSLEGGQIEDVANRLFAKWGIGQKGKDNGVLLITALEERSVRIEVGYGLEGILPDARTGRLLDEVVIPRFKEGQVAAGLADGAVAIARIVAQEAGVALTNAVPVGVTSSNLMSVAQPAEQMTFGEALFTLIFLLVIVVLIIIGAKRGIKGGSGSGGSSSRSSSSSGSGFGGFGGGRSGGGGASRSW